MSVWIDEQWTLCILTNVSKMATVRQRSTNSNIDNKSNEDDDVVTNKHSLLDWDDLEPWQQDNEHILSHYRSPSHNHWKSITSLAYLHNQTGNIYSHLLGTVAFLMLAFSLDYEFSDYYSRQDRILIACFLLGTIFCFGSSTYFHLSGNHSAEVYHAWLTMDFFGIITLITGTAFPLAYYSYPCHQITLKLCWISVCFSIPHWTYRAKRSTADGYRWQSSPSCAPSSFSDQRSVNVVGDITGLQSSSCSH